MHEALELLVLVGAGLVAGYVNAVAGAGSLLTLPALIFTGLDAGAANATNRIAVAVQNIAAIAAYRRGGVRVGAFAVRAIVPAAIAAAFGAWVASMVSDEVLRLSIAVAMAVFLVLSLIRPKKRPAAMGADVAVDGGTDAGPPALPPFSPSMVLGFAAIGFYAGFLQAGVGILILLYLGLVHGADLIATNALKVVIILVVALVAIAVFVMTDVPIDPLRGGLLAAATAVGSFTGARATLRKGSGLIRLMMVVAVVGSIVKLAWDAFSATAPR